MFENGFVFKEESEANNKQKLAIKSAYLHITNKCNLHCVACYSLDDNRNKCKDMSLEEIKHALLELKSVGVTKVVFSGGEPFLRKDISDMVIYAKEVLNIPSIDIITNGTVLDCDVLEKIANHVDSIAVSIDGYSKEHPTFIRDEGIFETVIKGVETIRDIGIKVSILPTIHEKNVYNLIDYVNLAKELKVGISFSLMTCNPDEFGDYVISEENLEYIAKSILDSNEDYVLNDTPLNYCLQVQESCGAGKTIISIDAVGNVYPCHMLHDKEFLMGNIVNNSLKDILTKSPVFDEFAKLSVESISECSECSYKYLCSSGCRARAFYNSGSVYTKDTFCRMNKIYFNSLTESIVNSYS